MPPQYFTGLVKVFGAFTCLLAPTHLWNWACFVFSLDSSRLRLQIHLLRWLAYTCWNLNLSMLSMLQQRRDRCRSSLEYGHWCGWSWLQSQTLACLILCSTRSLPKTSYSFLHCCIFFVYHIFSLIRLNDVFFLTAILKLYYYLSNFYFSILKFIFRFNFLFTFRVNFHIGACEFWWRVVD